MRKGGKSLSYNIGASGNTPEAGWGEFKDKKYKGINKASGSLSSGFDSYKIISSVFHLFPQFQF